MECARFLDEQDIDGLNLYLLDHKVNYFTFYNIDYLAIYQDGILQFTEDRELL